MTVADCTVCGKYLFILDNGHEGPHKDCAPRRRRELLATVAQPLRVARQQPMNDHLTRRWLSNGWFVDHDRLQAFRAVRDHPYSLWAPGQDPSGCALRLRTTRTLAQALAPEGNHA